MYRTPDGCFETIPQYFMNDEQRDQLNYLKQWEKVDKAMYNLDNPNPIDYCESHYPEMCKEFKRLQEEQYKLLCKKQMDYGPQNIAVGTKLDNQKEILAALTAIVVRLNDKVQRLVNLLLINHREPENESVEDTFMDSAVYSTIALTVRNGKWGK